MAALPRQRRTGGRLARCAAQNKSVLSVRLPCISTVMPHAGTATSLVMPCAGRCCLAHSMPSEAAGRAHYPPESPLWHAACRPLLTPGTLPAGLFSATQTEAVEQLARAGLRNPIRVNVVTNVAVPAPAPSARAGTVQATPAAEELQPAAAAAAALGSRRTPASLALQYMVCESTQKLDVLAAFLQVRLCSCRYCDRSTLRMRGGVSRRPLCLALGASFGVVDMAAAGTLLLLLTMYMHKQIARGCALHTHAAASQALSLLTAGAP